MTRARALGLSLLALAAGCMSVDATVEATVSAPRLDFEQGGAWAGELMSESRTVPVSFTSSLVREVSTVRIESVHLTPAAGVHTLDFFRGIALVVHDPGAPDVPLTSLGPELLQPAADGSLSLPVGVNLDAAVVRDGLSVEATIEFIVPGRDWSVAESFALQLSGAKTVGP